MTRWDEAVVQRKLQILVKYLDLLRSRPSLDRQAYAENIEEQAIIERSLHLLVESASDLNSHVLVRCGYPPPETYQESFLHAEKLGLIPHDLAEELVLAAKVRNRLVHL